MGALQRFGATAVFAIVLIWGASTEAKDSGTLSIITSFPPAFVERFKTAFERSHPDVTLVFIQRSTASGVRFLMERAETEADLFWASAPDAFEILKHNGQLLEFRVQRPDLESHIAGYPLHDPDGFYTGFALSYYGIAYNPDYVKRYNLPLPRDWRDLAAPVYAGHLGLSPPSRSGTTHLMIEGILQMYGWDRGWALLSQLGGNLSTVTARSYGVPSGVARERFGIGLTIDFLGQETEEAPGNIRFRALRPSLVTPASVAVLKRSRKPETAGRFIAFLLSDEAQRMLLDPHINRIPVDSKLRAAALERLSIEPAPERRTPDTVFDSALSARRYDAINMLFDEHIVHNRARLTRAWSVLHQAEEQGVARPLLGTARDLLLMPPVTAEQSVLPDLGQRAGAIRVQTQKNAEQAEAIARSLLPDHAGGAAP